MITAGLAIVYQFDRRFARQGAYERFEEEADIAGRGSWRRCPSFE